MALVVDALSALVALDTVLGAALMAVAVLAWRRARRPRFALVALAFGTLAVRSLAVSAGLFLAAPLEELLLLTAGLDGALLLLLYLAVVRG